MYTNTKKTDKFYQNINFSYYFGDDPVQNVIQEYNKSGLFYG